MSWLSQAWRATAPAFLGGGPKEGEAGTTISVSQRGANVGLKRIHGKRRVSATTVFKTPLKYNLPVTVVNHDNLVTRGFSEGTESAHRWLHRIDVWGQGPITSINKYWLDKDPHTADRFDDRNYFRALEYYGADDQTAYSDLTSKAPLWDANHRGRGVGYSATRFFNHADKPQFNAEPQLDAEIEGLPFYDARKDGTQAGGVGAHRLADPATWEWSDNNAVGLHNELIAVEGRNLPASRVNVASFQAGADKCDVQVAIPARLTNDTGAAIPKWWEGELGQYINIDIGALYPTYRRAQTGATQKRLTSNIVLDPADGARNNILKLLAGMRASLPFSQGQYKLVIEDAGASIMDFDEDSIFGGLTISSGGRADRLNQVTIEFPNENLDYQQDLVIWPAKGGAEHDAYVAEDNGEPLHKKISVESITDFYRAQDFAEFLVRSSRVNLSCEALLAPKACLLEYGDIIDLTHSTPSWAAKLFVVRNVEVQASRKGKLRLVKVKLDEYDPSDYPWSAKSNEPLQAPTNLPDPWADLPAVTGLGGTVINETNSDGSIGRYLDMVWTRPDDVPDEVMAEIAWKEDTDPIYSNFVKIDPAAEAYRINGLFDSVDYTIRHRYWNQLGRKSVV